VRSTRIDRKVVFRLPIDVQKRNAALYRRFSLETGLPLVALLALLI